MPATKVDGSPSSPALLAPVKKLGGGQVKPRPFEGKLWPIGLPKQAS